MSKREEALLRLDELAQQLEWGFIQEGGDLTFRRRGAQGYHYTSERNFTAVRAQGLGRHPGLIEAHEVPYWFVMPFLAPTTAAKLLARWEAHSGRYGDLSPEQHGVQIDLEKALARIKNLRVVWFYREPNMAGSTAGANDRCIRFDLHDVGEWLAENTDAPHKFGDMADGYAIAWIGPPIPSTLLVECDEDEF